MTGWCEDCHKRVEIGKHGECGVCAGQGTMLTVAKPLTRMGMNRLIAGKLIARYPELFDPAEMSGIDREALREMGIKA
jgi:hypothetical protein